MPRPRGIGSWLAFARAHNKKFTNPNAAAKYRELF